MEPNMLLLLASVWLVQYAACGAIGSKLMNSEAKLHADLFGPGAGYNHKVRPVLDSTKPVQCSFGIAVNNVLDINMVKGVATLAIWLRASWYDPFLDWNATEYGGLSQTVASVHDIWTPDWLAYNHVENFESNVRHDLSKVYLYSDGWGVYWSRPGVVKVTFDVDSTHFPYDDQEIPLEIGAWSNSGFLQNNSMMAYTIDDPASPTGRRRVTDGSLDLTVLGKSTEYVIETTPASRYDKYYACCPGEPWPIIRFVLRVSRLSQFYVQSIIMPNLVTTAVSFTTFFLPQECGERIGLGITCMLVICAMMVVSKDISPVTSELTVMSMFYLGCFLYTLSALCITVVSAILMGQKFDQDDDGDRGTRFCYKICGISTHQAILLSNRLDFFCGALCPVSFACFAVIVLNPTWTTAECIWGILLVLLAFVVLIFGSFAVVFGVRRALGLDTSGMCCRLALWLKRVDASWLAKKEELQGSRNVNQRAPPDCEAATSSETIAPHAAEQQPVLLGSKSLQKG